MHGVPFLPTTVILDQEAAQDLAKSDFEGRRAPGEAARTTNVARETSNPQRLQSDANRRET